MVRAARAHLGSLWPRGALWPVLPWVLYALYTVIRGEFRLEHMLVVAIVSVLAYTGPRTKELFLGLYPVGLVFIMYDGMRPFQKVGLTEARVHLCDLRNLESTIFGYSAGGARMTLHDWFRVHHAPAIDLLCAVPYATFVMWCIVGAIVLYVRDRLAMRQFMWAFFLVNVLGFVTYHILPAAPPWYFHERGCVVDLATKASEGPALARVDAMLGIGYFRGMYGKASSVFGALPSLHCAYPFLLVVAGFRAFAWKMRAFTIGYTIWMIFAAVYLDHHWLIDAMLGLTYALVSIGIVRLVTRLASASQRAEDVESSRTVAEAAR